MKKSVNELDKELAELWHGAENIQAMQGRLYLVSQRGDGWTSKTVLPEYTRERAAVLKLVGVLRVEKQMAFAQGIHNRALGAIPADMRPAVIAWRVLAMEPWELVEELIKVIKARES